VNDVVSPPSTFWKAAAISTAVFSALAFVFSSVIAAVWAQGFAGKVAPNVRVGGIDVSGLDAGAAQERVQQAVDQRLGQGITVNLNGKPSILPLTAVNGNGDTVEYAAFDVAGAVTSALQFDRAANPALDVALLLKRRFATSPADLPIPVTTNADALGPLLVNAYPGADVPAQQTRFALVHGRDGWNASVREGHGGMALDLAAFWPRLRASLRALDPSPVVLTMTKTEAPVSAAEAELVMPDALAAMERGPYRLLERPDGSGRSWTIPSGVLADLIVPEKTGGRVALAIDRTAFDGFVSPIADALEIAPQDARFQIVDGRVTQFETSKTGMTLDRDATRGALSDALFAGAPTDVPLTLVAAAPDITTEKGNDLGITEELGSGTSNYKNSPVNRVKNIRNGVRLLNGLLIAPGENFSLLNALKPFDVGNGYLSELVIKGDKIEPDIGGGLCQIGTTAFRMAMNSGMPITARQNHSLVVSYYNDPSNGNPGTDATIFDPAPDFRFTNDTGHYLLLQAEMDDKTQTLTFHLWGTSDGRKGSYSPPKVLRWIPYGDEVDTQSPDLPAGTQKCQAAHVGADTSFVYTVTLPDGTSVDREFDSHYRPLPKLCLVGTGPATTTSATLSTP
jgi:vancomycin resistance protein YoaR